MFGEKVEGFPIPVLNEREVRAGAGILFFISTVVFLGAWYADLMLPAQMMIIGFFIDFAIRVVNTRYSPSLILGRLAVSNQTPEYTAAAPKRFAWMIGLVLAGIMIVTLIFMRQMSIVNFAICAVCIVLLFMESAFGICLGCLVYNKVLKKEVALCPGNVCEVRPKEAIQKVSHYQYALLAVFAISMFGILNLMSTQNHELAHSGPNHQIIKDLKEGLALPMQIPEAPPAEMMHEHHH